MVAGPETPVLDNINLYLLFDRGSGVIGAHVLLQGSQWKCANMILILVHTSEELKIEPYLTIIAMGSIHLIWQLVNSEKCVWCIIC